MTNQNQDGDKAIKNHDDQVDEPSTRWKLFTFAISFLLLSLVVIFGREALVNRSTETLIPIGATVTVSSHPLSEDERAGPTAVNLTGDKACHFIKPTQLNILKYGEGAVEDFVLVGVISDDRPLMSGAWSGACGSEGFERIWVRIKPLKRHLQENADERARSDAFKAQSELQD